MSYITMMPTHGRAMRGRCSIATKACERVAVTQKEIRDLDVRQVRRVAVELEGKEGASVREAAVGFDIDYPREPGDPRELCEIPEVRMWYLRLDGEFPWLPVTLDWKQGELARYAAMCVPNQVSREEGIVYNPEALELWVTQKMFLLWPWLVERGFEKPEQVLRDMAKMFGYDIHEEFFRTTRRSFTDQ